MGSRERYVISVMSDNQVLYCTILYRIVLYCTVLYCRYACPGPLHVLGGAAPPDPGLGGAAPWPGPGGGSGGARGQSTGALQGRAMVALANMITVDFSLENMMIIDQ